MNVEAILTSDASPTGVQIEQGTCTARGGRTWAEHVHEGVGVPGELWILAADDDGTRAEPLGLAHLLHELAPAAALHERDPCLVRVWLVRARDAQTRAGRVVR
jgi:hypothetical protein